MLGPAPSARGILHTFWGVEVSPGPREGRPAPDVLFPSHLLCEQFPGHTRPQGTRPSSCSSAHVCTSVSVAAER